MIAQINLTPEDERASILRERAIVDHEERLLGWQIKGAPGVSEITSVELRSHAAAFQMPYSRIQEAIFKAMDENRAITVSGIAADLHDCAALTEIGGSEHLQNLAFASPAVISFEHGAKLAREAIKAWRALRHTTWTVS